MTELTPKEKVDKAMRNLSYALEEVFKDKVEPIDWPQEGDEVWLNVGYDRAKKITFDRESHDNYLHYGELFKTEADCIRDDQRRRATALLQRIADRQGEVSEDKKSSLYYDKKKDRWCFYRVVADYCYPGDIPFSYDTDLGAIQEEFKSAGLDMAWLL